MKMIKLNLFFFFSCSELEMSLEAINQVHGAVVV